MNKWAYKAIPGNVWLVYVDRNQTGEVAGTDVVMIFEYETSAKALADLHNNSIPNLDEIKAAIRHSANFNGLDARCNTPDYTIADLLGAEVEKWLYGTTDVQVFEAMTPEERAKI